MFIVIFIHFNRNAELSDNLIYEAYPSDSKCSICNLTDLHAVFPNHCSHTYCAHCMVLRFKDGNCCPLCSAEIRNFCQMFPLADQPAEQPAGQFAPQRLLIPEDDEVQIIEERITVPKREYVFIKDSRFLNRRRLYVERGDSLNNEVLELPSINVDLNSEKGLLHQIERFMVRDLKAVLLRFQMVIPAAVKRLTPIIREKGITNNDFKNKVKQYLGSIAHTFLYELYSFANSKQSVENYDLSIRHVWQDSPSNIVDISAYHLDNVDRLLPASTINFQKTAYRLIQGEITSMN